MPQTHVRPIRNLRRRIADLLRQRPVATPWALLAILSAELRKSAPELAAALTPSLLKGWIDSARKLVKDAGLPALPPVEPPSILGDLFAPSPDVKWPAIEAGVKDLMSRQVLTWPQYRILADQAKNTAFSVARVLTEDGVANVRGAVASAVADGMSLKQFATAAPELANAGLAEHQVETIFRTQVAQARSAGMRSVLSHAAVAAEFPYVAYHAVHDSRTGDKVPGLSCPSHLMMEQLGIQGTNIYRADDPVIIKFTPPWRWNCRCGIIPLSIEDAAAAGLREARLWQRTGVEARRTWVPHPPFDLPPGWPRGGSAIRPIV